MKKTNFTKPEIEVIELDIIFTDNVVTTSGQGAGSPFGENGDEWQPDLGL